MLPDKSLNYDELTKNIRSLTKGLRVEYYMHSKQQSNSDVIPFGGSIRESIGPFPEFILKGRFCRRSNVGMCSPCFYSRLPEHDITESSFDEGYLSQVDYIIENFDTIVIKNQIGKTAFHHATNKPVYGMVCTPTGSYFDNNEYPIDIRKKNLSKILLAAKAYDCEIALHIETHVEDILNYFLNPDKEEMGLLKSLNARIMLGFESQNAFSRNVVYNKNLNLSDFEETVSLIKNHDIPVGAFVFAGLFAYNDLETINDVRSTLLYLKDLDVSPVIMFANTQKYTIPDVLFSQNMYKLLDAHTVLEITKLVVDIFGCDMNRKIDPWFIADPKGGPPDPNMHIFNAQTNTACSKCSDDIYNAIEQLRITKDLSEFYQSYERINSCDCVKQYKELIFSNRVQCDEISIEDRVNNCISCVSKYKTYYVLQENPWVVKAELLCYGLNLTTEQRQIASNYNCFINEKGLINAVHIKFKDTLINVCVSETFCMLSPYTANYSDGIWTLYKNTVYIGEFCFIKMPEWYLKKINGIPIGKVLRPHSNNCLSIWPSTECVFVSKGLGCKFCGLNSPDYKHYILESEFVLSAINEAFKYNLDYEINISGGTFCSSDKSIVFLADLCREIKSLNQDACISVECAPPSDNNLIHNLHNSGASAIIMNIEIYDEGLRRQICPGKSCMSIEKYFNSLEYAVSVFGKGNVSSVIIMGIQPNEDILVAAEKLISIGVIPTIMPFKPLDNTELQNYPLPNSDEYIEISRSVAKMMSKHGLVIEQRSGCAACGACSLEIDLI